jgi:hypothetical protein
MSLKPASQFPCGQCGRQSVAAVDNAPLCVDCYYKLEVARTLGFRSAAIGMNYAAAEMDSVVGLQNFTPRIQVPDIPRGPTILHNIKVDNSVVGSINTGNVQSIDVSITYLKEAGSKQISEALKALAEAIANSSDLAAPVKRAGGSCGQGQTPWYDPGSIRRRHSRGACCDCGGHCLADGSTPSEELFRARIGTTSSCRKGRDDLCSTPEGQEG